MSSIPITLTFPPFDPIEVEVFPTTTVTDVKHLICDDYKTRSELIDLLYEGNPIPESNPVVDVGISSGDILEIVQSKRGRAIQFCEKLTAEDLFHDIEFNDGEYVNYFVDAGINLDGVIDKTIEVNNQTASLKLLELPDLNLSMSSHNRTPALNWVTDLNNIELAKAMINHPNIDVNLTVNSLLEENPLFICCRRNFHEIAKSLISHQSIDVNKKMYRRVLGISSSYSMLFTAITNGSYEVLKVLLQHPSLEVNYTEIGLTPMGEALRRHDHRIVELLRSYNIT